MEKNKNLRVFKILKLNPISGSFYDFEIEADYLSLDEGYQVLEKKTENGLSVVAIFKDELVYEVDKTGD